MKRYYKYIFLILIVSIGIIVMYNNNNSNTEILKEEKIIEKNEDSLAFYIKDGEEYKSSSNAPTSGYQLNTENSKCTLNDVDQNIEINYNFENQTLSLNPLPSKGSKCNLYFDIKQYTITGASNNTSSGTVTSSTIKYGGTTTLTITPESGYYLSAFSCDINNYTIDGVSTGSSYTSEQIASISNNNIDSGTTCTATFIEQTCTVTKRTYTYAQTFSNINGYWVGTYTCVGNRGTIKSCSIDGMGDYNCSSTYACTADGTITFRSCNSYPTNYYMNGGGMSETITCSCS